MNTMMKRFLTTKEAAYYLGLKEPTLEKWRTMGIGPRYYRLGTKAVRYEVSDLEEWARIGETNAKASMAMVPEEEPA